MRNTSDNTCECQYYLPLNFSLHIPSIEFKCFFSYISITEICHFGIPENSYFTRSTIYVY